MNLIEALTTEQDGCLLWRGVISSQGYAITRIDGEKQYVHRLLTPGSENLEVHHLCGNRSCVNEEHLVVVTSKQHSAYHLKDECIHGHAYTQDNVYITPGGTRQCRTCKSINNARAAKKRRLGIPS